VATATYEDVGVALRRTISDTAEQAQIEHWLTGAEMAIRSRLGDPALLDQDVLKYVETEAVAEKVRRAGRDESSITVSIDDGSVTRRYEGAAMSIDDISADYWSLLSPKRASSAYTIAVVSPLDLP
jgi:hypothetical protein